MREEEGNGSALRRWWLSYADRGRGGREPSSHPAQGDGRIGQPTGR
eukprot:gene6628-4748_t